MDIFTLVTGLASLFGFAMQIFDVFPKFSQGRQSVLLLLIGGFLGSIVSTIDASSVKLAFVLDGYTLSMTALAAVIVFFAVAAAFTADTRRRRGFYIVGGIAALGFAITTSVVALVRTVSDSDVVSAKRLQPQELSWLAEKAELQGDLQRAQLHLETLAGQMDDDDPRHAELQQRMDRLKQREVQAPGVR